MPSILVRFTNEYKFPEPDPVHCTAKVRWAGQRRVSTEQMEAFRALGYWASCYPDHSGISFYSTSGPRPDAQVIADLESCFDFIVKRPGCEHGMPGGCCSICIAERKAKDISVPYERDPWDKEDYHVEPVTD